MKKFSCLSSIEPRVGLNVKCSHSFLDYLVQHPSCLAHWYQVTERPLCVFAFFSYLFLKASMVNGTWRKGMRNGAGVNADVCARDRP